MVSRRCLLVAFHARLALALVDECPGNEYQLGDKRYRDKGYGELTGFYDWLRDSSGKLLGVRYWPFEETSFLSDVLSEFPSVVVAKDRSYLEVYFSSDRRVDRQRSDDQDLGANKVFSTEQGEWAISFDTTALSPSEMENVYAADADWQSASLKLDG